LVLARLGARGAGEIQERTNRSIGCPLGEDCPRRDFPERNAVRLGRAVRDLTERGDIVGFDTRLTGGDARSGSELRWQLADECDQHSSCGCSYGGIRRSTRLQRSIERVRPGMSLNGIDGVVDGYMHDRVDARFMEWVVQWRDAGRGGGFAGVLVPG